MGRHKLFERNEVTDKALFAFWQKGYADTSLSDLEKATGVFKPALYSEFGDKEGLFLECVKHYRENYSGRLQLLKDNVGWGNIEEFLKSTVPTNEKRCCFEASVFARDIPILPEKLKPLLEENTKNILEAIKSNLKSVNVKKKQLEEMTNNIFTIYCGLGVLANYESKVQLEERIQNSLKLIKSSVIT